MLMTYDEMTIKVPSTHHFTLRYEDYFFVHLFEKNLFTLPEMLDIIRADFNLFPWLEHCDLIDADTGEVLFEVCKT